MDIPKREAHACINSDYEKKVIQMHYTISWITVNMFLLEKSEINVYKLYLNRFCHTQGGTPHSVT